MPERTPDVIHYSETGTLTACLLTLHDWRYGNTNEWERVTCESCKRFRGVDETAGRPAVVPMIHFTTPKLLTAGRSACGLDHRFYQVDSRPEAVTCPYCLNSPPFRVRHGLTVRHFREDTNLPTACGIARTGVEGVAGTNSWGFVNCPDCLNFHSRESEIRMSLNDHKLQQQQDTQQRITAEHRHDWNMVDGPKWPHDCEGCIYLGTRHYIDTYDLYWCPQGTHPTVIARRGEGGDYESGLDFVDRTPIMALAYVRAINAGLVQG